MEKKLDLILEKIEKIEVQLNEHTKLHQSHEERFKSHTELLNYIVDILKNHSGKLDSHSEILDRHSEILVRHSKILDRHSEKFDQLNARVDENSHDIKTIKSNMISSSDIKYLDQKIAEHDREMMKTKRS